MGNETISVELAKPTAQIKILGDPKLVNAAKDADHRLAQVLESMHKHSVYKLSQGGNLIRRAGPRN